MLVKHIDSGVSVNASDWPAGPGEFGVLKTSCVYRGVFDHLENKTVDDSEIPRLSCSVVAGSVIVSRMNTPDLVGAAGLVKESNGRLFLPDRLWQVRVAGVPAFFHYWTQSSEYRSQVAVNAVGTSSSMQNLSQRSFGQLSVSIPPLPEQRSIANFLDRETTEIDSFIADQEELIGLLAERRDAGWQSAFDNLKAPHVPLRRVIESVADGPFGSSLTSAHYTDEGARVVRLGNIGINEFKDGDRAFISMDYFAELAAHSVRQGDVVVAGLGDDRMPLGRAAVVPDLGPAIVKADCYRLRPRPVVTSAYLAWVLSAPQSRARMRELSRGSTRQRLNTSVVQDVAIPLPTLATQSQVVGTTMGHVQELDAAIADAREAIRLSRERRSALISAAVTGRIDVRDA